LQSETQVDEAHPKTRMNLGSALALWRALCTSLSASLLIHGAKYIQKGGGGDIKCQKSFHPFTDPCYYTHVVEDFPSAVLHNTRRGLWGAVCEATEPRAPSPPASSARRSRGRGVLMGSTDLGINIHTAALHMFVCVCVYVKMQIPHTASDCLELCVAERGGAERPAMPKGQPCYRARPVLQQKPSFNRFF